MKYFQVTPYCWEIHTQDTIKGSFKNDYAFAAVTNKGKVITWGDSEKGRHDCHNESADLNRSVYSNSNAFAAIKSDGSVVAWETTAMAEMLGLKVHP